MSRKLVKTSKYVQAYYNADSNSRKRARTRIDNYLSKAEVSLDILSTQLSEILGIEYTRKPTSGLLEFLGYPKKDKNLVNVAKKNSSVNYSEKKTKAHLKEILDKLELNGGTKHTFSKAWKELSFNEIKKKWQLSQNDSYILAKHYNLGEKVNSQYEYTYIDMYNDLLEVGESNESIEKMYLIDLIPVKEILNYYKRILNNDLVTIKRLEKILKMLNLNRTESQLKNQQGRKSRAIKAANMAKLARSGYTIESLADRYENDLTLTKRGILREINSKVFPYEELFTDRWLSRHLDPLLSKVRLGGVSRSEREFTSILEGLYPDLKIETSVRTLIPPQEVDIYIPELNLAIEFNGDYWHSDKFMLENHKCTSEDYHKMKQDKCKELGVNLVFVWESDWVDNDNLVLNAISVLIKESKVSPILNKLKNNYLDEEVIED